MVKILAISLCLLTIHCIKCEIQDIYGVVNIQNATDVITVTSNDDGSYVPIYLIAVNDTGAGQVYQPDVVINETVLVTCEVVTPYTDGNAAVEFLDDWIPQGEIEGNVYFNITEQGREVDIRCRGQNQQGSMNSTNLFHYSTSQGSPGYLVVKKSPVVSFCDEVVEVPYAEQIKSGTVTVKLSEPVDEFDVTISCKIDKVVDNETFLWLSFSDVNATAGMDSIVMEYTIKRYGSPVLVTCRAISSQGRQFLAETSAGPSALFVLASGSIHLLPTVSYVYAPTFTAYLVLSSTLQPNEGEVTFVCDLVPINSTEFAIDTVQNPLCAYPDPPEMSTAMPLNTTVCPSDGNTTCPMVPTTSPIPMSSAAPNISQMSPWMLKTSEFVFEEGDLYKEVVAELRSPYGSYDGPLVLTCCGAYDINTSPKYTNVSAALAVLSDVKPILHVNTSTVPDSSVGLQETELLNPAYVEVSPCPCDLYRNKCDTDCCCDMDCSEDDESLFTCMEGIPGGNFTDLPDYLCGTSSLYHSDWFPFLCVTATNSPHLGLFYSTITSVADISSFNSLKSQTILPSTTSFEDTSSRELDFEENTGSVGYKNGYPIELLYESNLRGYLTLPIMSEQGECDSSSLVRFQEDSASECNQEVQSSSCADYTPLSARSYLQSSSSSYPPCPAVPQVIQEYRQAHPSSTTVSYYCLGGSTDSYLKSSKGYILDPTKTELFNGEENVEEVTITRCEWDDGFTVPRVPTLNPETDTCDNVVLEVEYQLFWSGGAVVLIEASIILGSVPISGNISDSDDGYDFITAPPFPDIETTAPVTDASDVTTDMVTELNDVVTESELNDIPTEFPDNFDIFLLTDSPPTLAPPPATPLATPVMLATPFSSTPDNSTTAQVPATVNNTVPPIPDIPLQFMNTMQPLSNDSTPEEEYSGVQTLTQHFRVTFIHLPEESMDSDTASFDYVTFDTMTTLSDKDTVQYQRSGNPGYDIGRMVVSGKTVYEVVGTTTPVPFNCTVDILDPLCNDTVENITAFSRVDVSDGSRLQLINPGVSGLCSEASAREVSFGENTFSGCLLRLSLSDLSNCTELREYMKEELMKYMPADVIGKTGDPDVLAQRDWASVFSCCSHCVTHETISWFSSTVWRGNKVLSVDVICKTGELDDLVQSDWASVFIPDDILDDPNTTQQPTEEPATTTEAPPTTHPGQYYVQDPTPPPMDQLTGVCFDVPTGINLEVLITDAGEYNGYMLQEIAAAKIKYTLSNVQMSCSGADGVRCQSGNTTGIEEEFVQSFMVTSSVTFTKVPPVPPEPVILFYKDYDPTLCKQDACWSEMIYPITESFQGDSIEYSLAVAMVTLLITTGYLIVTKPWFGLSFR